MRLSALLVFCTAAIIAQGQSDTDHPFATIVSIQPIDASTSSIDPLAHIQYDPTTLEAVIASYDSPDVAPGAGLARVGVYDKATKAWASSTSILSMENFTKGYAPVITLSLGPGGDVIGVSCKSEKIDAGHTRDFGPKVTVRRTADGKTPSLNRPIALSKEGKVEKEEPEKTFMQKYWMFGMGILLVLVLSGGGDK
ncbi:hypothetical protein V494_00302 [Pseudogymnoascus sp. VKM F-4513 (FW-928)]|nr:hypothetical protein V494_00302 [Pseudogymnoascus sp. VKM F-4513 (FW-928)]